MNKPVDKSGNADAAPRPFESFQVGETHRSPDRLLSQKEVAAFAELTGDKNPIHLDAEFARGTVFRSTIAHGLFLASILAGMAYERGLLGKNILAIEHSTESYLQPVKPGDTIYGMVAISGLDPEASKRCGRVSWDLTLFRKDSNSEEDAPVLEAHWRTLVFKKAYLKP